VSAPEWRLVQDVAPEGRERFRELAAASAFATRARHFEYDEVDSNDLGRLYQEYVAAFAAESDGHSAEAAVEAAFQDGLNRLPDRAAVTRIEKSDHEIEAWMWEVLTSDCSLWEDSTKVLNGGRFCTIWSGVQFDFAKARLLGVQLRDQVMSAETTPKRKGRPGGRDGAPIAALTLCLAKLPADELAKCQIEATAADLIQLYRDEGEEPPHLDNAKRSVSGVLKMVRREMQRRD
jgi:hypothetical protein